MELNKEIKQAEIWLVRFEPQIGSEISKTRPAIVISNNTFNLYQNLCFCVPLTTWQDKFNSRLGLIKVVPNQINGLTNVSVINCYQLKTFDKQRFINKIGEMEHSIIAEIQLIINEIIDENFIP